MQSYPELEISWKLTAIFFSFFVVMYLELEYTKNKTEWDLINTWNIGKGILCFCKK